MRILCYLHALDIGGVERVATKLCRAWAAGGAEVVLLLGRHAGPAPDLPPSIRVEMPAGGRFALPAIEDLWMAAWLPGAIARHRPDMIFCAGNTYAVSAIMAKLAMGGACPPIVAKISNDLHRHDLPIPLRLLYHAWCRIQGSAFDSLVAIAAPMLAEINRFAEPRRPADLVEDAVLETEPAPARSNLSPGHGRRFLAIGRLEPQKNFALMIDAFAAGAAPGDRLAIVGDGSLRDSLARRIERLGVGDRVTLGGHHADVAPWLRVADALLLSSHYEGMPAVVIEALASGTPVIATDCCAALADLLADGRCGTLVPAGDPAALARAIATFDPAACDGAAMIARAAPYTVPRAAARYLRLFADVTRTASAPLGTTIARRA